MFEFITSLTDDIASAADAQEQAYADPETVTTPAAGVMADGADTTDLLVNKAVKQDAESSPAPTVETPGTPGQ